MRVSGIIDHALICQFVKWDGSDLGAGCLNDPLHDYVRKRLDSQTLHKAQKLFRYAQRRAKAQLRAIESHIAKQEVIDVAR